MPEQHESNIWDIEVIERSQKRVDFGEVVTAEEARRRMAAGEYEDIIDERDFEILGVLEAS